MMVNMIGEVFVDVGGSCTDGSEFGGVGSFMMLWAKKLGGVDRVK